MEANKLSVLSENFVSKVALFEDINSEHEAKKLALLAGKLLYSSKNTSDDVKAKKLKDAARLLLLAADILKY